VGLVGGHYLLYTRSLPAHGTHTQCVTISGK
jgi:hypothetical protein